MPGVKSLLPVLLLLLLYVINGWGMCWPVGKECFNVMHNHLFSLLLTILRPLIKQKNLPAALCALLLTNNTDSAKGDSWKKREHELWQLQRAIIIIAVVKASISGADTLVLKLRRKDHFRFLVFINFSFTSKKDTGLTTKEICYVLRDKIVTSTNLWLFLAAASCTSWFHSPREW